MLSPRTFFFSRVLFDFCGKTRQAWLMGVVSWTSLAFLFPIIRTNVLTVSILYHTKNKKSIRNRVEKRTAKCGDKKRAIDFSVALYLFHRIFHAVPCFF